MQLTVSAIAIEVLHRRLPGYAKNSANSLKQFAKEHQLKSSMSSAMSSLGSQHWPTRLASTSQKSSIAIETVVRNVQHYHAHAEPRSSKQQFSDLDGVQRSTLAQVVIRNEQRKTSVTID
jgi:hypothetical protein